MYVDCVFTLLLLTYSLSLPLQFVATVCHRTSSNTPAAPLNKSRWSGEKVFPLKANLVTWKEQRHTALCRALHRSTDHSWSDACVLINEIANINTGWFCKTVRHIDRVQILTSSSVLNPGVSSLYSPSLLNRAPYTGTEHWHLNHEVLIQYVHKDTGLWEKSFFQWKT